MQKTLFSFLMTVVFVVQLNAQDLSGSWIDTNSKAKFWISQKAAQLNLETRNGNNFSGKLTSDSIRLHFQYKSLDHIPTSLSLATREQMLKDGILIKGKVEKSTGTEKLFLTYYNPIYSQGVKKRDSLIHYELIRGTIQFENKNGKIFQLVTDVSHPYPVIKLDEFSASQIRIHDEKITLKVSGKINDAIADIVKDKADIKTVTVEFTDLVSKDEESKSIKIDIKKTQSPESDDPWKPYPFEGRFEKEITIPVWSDQVNVVVKATNIAGNTGLDGFTIQMDDEGRVTSVKHDESTDPGLFNPVLIKLFDPSPVDVESVALSDIHLMNGKKLPIKAIRTNSKGSFRSELPIIALSKPVSSDIPNVIHALSANMDTKIKYRNFEEEFYWSYTTHSPPNYYKYAGGTTVDHEIRSPLFARYELKEAVVNKNYSEPDNFIKAHIRAELPGGDGLAPGYVVQMEIEPQAGIIGPEKTFTFTLEDRRTKRVTKILESVVGAFKAIYRLKLVIVTIDGLAYHSIDTLLKTSDVNIIPTFKKVFDTGINLDRPALSALPTITWCNWPGIFSMQPPRDHGVIGNAFFGRETIGANPLATGPSLGLIDLGRRNGTSYDGLQVSKGKLVKYAKTSSGSFYDNFSQSLKASGPKAISVHQWYYKHSPNLISVDTFSFPDWWKYGTKRLTKFTHHSEEAARLMDRLSGQLAASQFGLKHNMLDVLTVYYPGPDNIAHAIGETPNKDTGAYPAGPAIPNDRTPLFALKEHVMKHSDRNFKRLVDTIQSRGYLYATMFALTADHGLHAFHNKPGFNITLYESVNGIEQGLINLFNLMGYKTWTIYTKIAPDIPPIRQNIKDQNLVYAPNGGLAHIYLRSEGKTWQQPPAKADIDRLAARLYIEASGGVYSDPLTGAQKKYTLPLLYPTFWPKANPALKNPARGNIDYGALGRPPAIFAKENFEADFRWVKFIDPVTMVVQYGTIAEFLMARQTARDPIGNLLYPGFDWPEFEKRLDEMNDKNPRGSRTGDIVIVTDGYMGYMSINNGDELNGWHGGPSRSESFVPLFFNIPGRVVKKDFMEKALNDAYMQTRNQREYFRNWDMGRILISMYNELYPE